MLVPELIKIKPIEAFKNRSLRSEYNTQCDNALKFWTDYIFNNVENGIEIEDKNIMIISKGINNPGYIRISIFNHERDYSLYAVMHKEYKPTEMKRLFNHISFFFRKIQVGRI